MAQEIFATQSGNTYSAEVTRRAVFAQYARTASNSPGIISGGLIAAGDLALTAPASGMSVNVAVGEAIIGGSEGGAQGGYYFRNSAQQNLSISAAAATNPRIDTVVVTAGDSLYTEPSDVLAGTNAGVLAVVTGTPTAGATLGNLSGAAAVPLSSLVLGYVLVPATSTNVITANIANVASVANPQFIGTSGLGNGQPLVYNAATAQWRALAAGSAAATFPQLLSSHKLVCDDNGGAFYDTTTQSLAGGASVNIGFTTAQSWSHVLAVGSFYETGGMPAGYWTYTYTSGTTVTIRLANTAASTGTMRWIGYFIGN